MESSRKVAKDECVHDLYLIGFMLCRRRRTRIPSSFVLLFAVVRLRVRLLFTLPTTKQADQTRPAFNLSNFTSQRDISLLLLFSHSLSSSQLDSVCAIATGNWEAHTAAAALLLPSSSWSHFLQLWNSVIPSPSRWCRQPARKKN